MGRVKKRIVLNESEDEDDRNQHTFINNSDYNEASEAGSSRKPSETSFGIMNTSSPKNREMSSPEERLSMEIDNGDGDQIELSKNSSISDIDQSGSDAESPSSDDAVSANSLMFEDAPDVQPDGPVNNLTEDPVNVTKVSSESAEAPAGPPPGQELLSRNDLDNESNATREVITPIMESKPTFQPPSQKLGPTNTDQVSRPVTQGTSSTSNASDRLSFSQQQVTIVSPTKRRNRESFLMPDVRSCEPRLVITKLVLTNFKSYAGVQEIGPFNASFSAVVGPNGSGKSNVIDSMLFVFGFRASKMRQGKLSELIHNSVAGSEIEYCQVDIHFHHVTDDPQHQGVAHPVPGSELVISRRAFRTNGSQYFINNKSSSYSEVTSYLKGQGIDLDHKRFLILQGEVESIAQMKAKAERDNDDGLLEFLEDIIGTTKYKSLIDSSLTQIEELNQLCMEKENRFELVETDTNSMEEKKNEALRFLNVEKSLTNKRSISYQVSINEHQQTLESNNKIESEIAERLAEEVEKNKDISNELDDAHAQKSSLLSELEKLNKEISVLSKKQKSVNSQNVALEEKHKNVSQKIKKIQKAKATSESALSASTMRFNNLKAESEKFHAELAGLESSLDKEKDTLAKLRSNLTEKTSHFSSEISGLQTKLEPFNDKMKEKDRASELIKSEIDMLESKRKNLENRLLEGSKRLSDIKVEGKAKEAELELLNKKISHIEEQIGLGEDQCGIHKKTLEHKRVRLATARSKTSDAVSKLANVANKNAVLASLTKLSKSGRITGFHGRLGDLGVIDDKFDVAVSTACPALDSMVVDTVETAQACIDYLRKNRLGYANFICLNKLSRFNMGPIRTPGSAMTVKRIFDLITPKDPVFLPAFYSKLRDTLVASNLQEAKSVAYGPTRFKVVTLDGKVVDTSGTMSGGGNSSARGGMRLRSNATNQESEYSEDDVNMMRNELSAMETEVQSLDIELHEMEANLRKLKDLKPDTEFAIQTAQLDITSLVNEGKEVSKTIKQLLAEKQSMEASTEVDSAVEAKREMLEEILNSKKELKQQMNDSESRIAELEEKIMEAGGIELKAQNSKIDSIKQQIEIISQKSSEDHITLKKLENEIKRHTKIVSESDVELEQTDKDSADISEELTKNRSIRTDLAEQIKTLQQSVNEIETSIEKVELTLEELTLKMNEFKSEEIELRNQLEKIQGVQKKCRRLIEDAQSALSEIVVRDTAPYLEWMKEEERTQFDSSAIHQLDDDELQNVNLGEVEQEIKELERYMSEVKVDVEILKEYGVKRKELDIRRDELNESVEQRDRIRNDCEEHKRRRLDEFMEGFNTISLSLKEMYQMITMGGNAELELVDTLDPFSEGILFSVMPPKKSWKNISNLSGGEKTLSSLALVFALHKYKPTPLYVMDEIDAALDFRNVSIVANYIKERTKNAQFIVISLRNNMFELAQQLVGIYKVSNMTRSISMQNTALFVEDSASQK